MWTPDTNTIIDGRYRCKAKIGTGSIAAVWEGTDSTMNSKVVIKVPNPDSGYAYPTVRSYLEREQDLLQQLSRGESHSGIVSYLDSGTTQEIPYLVVEYIDGITLDEFIISNDVIRDPDQVREFGIELCEIISFIHQRGVIHRDLKPDNLMMTSDREIRLIDFNTGSLRSPTEDDTAGWGNTVLRGPFKSPEVEQQQSDRMKQGPYSDVYSIGKLLLYLMSGRGSNANGEQLSEYDIAAPEYLDEIIVRATATDSQDRYSNARAMQKALEAKRAGPTRVATLKYRPTGSIFTISPGDSIGRTETSFTPNLAIRDEDEYISPVHLIIDMNANGEWIIVDSSQNGTWRWRDGDWTELRNPTQLEILREAGYDPDVSGTVTDRATLSPGDLIAPVAPDYGATFEFVG